MAYPPPMNRPPLPMPPLPPGMQPPSFAGFPPLPPGTSMPLSMSMIPPSATNTSSPPTTGANRQSYTGGGSFKKTESTATSQMRRFTNYGRKNYQQSRMLNTYRRYDKKDYDMGRDDDDPNKPKTTVFVGNISDRASDMMIRQLLAKCGSIVSWKRVQGASGKLQAFGFCEYADPEASLRAMRLLHEWQIAEKKLVVKVDAKTRALLDDYLAKKKDDDDESDTKDFEDFRDHDVMKKDRIFRLQLDNTMKEYAVELNKSYGDEDGDGSQRKKKKVPTATLR